MKTVPLEERTNDLVIQALNEFVRYHRELAEAFKTKPVGFITAEGARLLSEQHNYLADEAHALLDILRDGDQVLALAADED